MRAVFGIAAVALVIAYPLVVYFGLSHAGTREAGLVLLAVVLPGLVLRARRTALATLGTVLIVPATVLACVALGIVLDNARFYLVLPTLINLAMLAQFGRTLVSGMPMIERFARMSEPTLTETQIRYCRIVTVVWCCFFALNAATTLLLALTASLAAWSFYTGIVSYVVMGALFAGEYIVRKYRFRSYGNAFYDRMFAAIFPPPP
ncbi:MAG: hypothetical protein IPK60_00450 [Sandaracinaceae bacterium]|nr:hypothetical protein [Sandaracinaceae bacterium]